METLKRRIVQLTVIIRYVLCLCYVKIFHINHPEVWLISERGDDARDNGYAFYEYMKKNHPEIAFKYIISKKSQDFNRITKEAMEKCYGCPNNVLFKECSEFFSQPENMGNTGKRNSTYQQIITKCYIDE